MFRDKMPCRRVFPSCVLTEERSVPQPDGTVKLVRVSSNMGIPEPFTTDLKAVLEAGIPLQQVSRRLPLASVDFDSEV